MCARICVHMFFFLVKCLPKKRNILYSTRSFLRKTRNTATRQSFNDTSTQN